MIRKIKENEKHNMAKRWLNVEELAEYLGMSPKTIYNKIGPNAKKPFPIKPKKFGKFVRWDLQAVDEYMDSL